MNHLLLRFTMRPFAILLALHTIVISLMPCDDAISGSMNVTGTVEKPHHQHENDADNCSPFCFCSCCAGFEMQNLMNNEMIPFNLASRAYPVYTKNFSFSHISEFWQPPRVV